MAIGKNFEDGPKVVSIIDSEAVTIAAENDTVNSVIFMFPKSMAASVLYKLAGAAINVKVELEISYDGTNFVTYSTIIDSGCTDALRHIEPIAPPVCLYGRLLLTGLAGNVNTTISELQVALANKGSAT